MRYLPVNLIRCFPALAICAVLIVPSFQVMAREPAAPPTVAEAEEFVAVAEALLMEHWIKKERAYWVQENFITHDTEVIAAEAYRELMAITGGTGDGSGQVRRA